MRKHKKTNGTTGWETGKKKSTGTIQYIVLYSNYPSEKTCAFRYLENL